MVISPFQILCVLILKSGTCYEIFKRVIFNKFHQCPKTQQQKSRKKTRTKTNKKQSKDKTKPKQNEKPRVNSNH
jgi:hypothetical protein